MSVAVRIDRLAKCFRIQDSAAGGRYKYRTLRDDLMRLARAPVDWLRRPRQAARGTSEFWALKDVSLEIGTGDVVGIIGRNGAGKSTLLKILSRITKPTRGEVELHGRVGSLLEVGTGFHPELTGRENIYLNGAVLGMKRWEIARKFDQIVAFAEIEKFLDTPVKRYSSGMYVRLAFAVAAHLEPEILIVDEVLAVGDLAFQRKCMGRMGEFGRSGCTVLFVSHNMPAIETLCTRAVMLDHGRVVCQGEVPEVVRHYRQAIMAAQGTSLDSAFAADGPCRKQKLFCSAELLDEQGVPTNYLPLGARFHLRLGLDVPEVLPYPQLGVAIDDTLGHRMLTVHTPLSTEPIKALEGCCHVDCCIERFPLAPGDYWVKLGISHGGQQLDAIERALCFSVTDGEAFGEGRGFSRGLCVAPSEWALVASTQEAHKE
jgi:lipopolysaccharide transport system ATP-binding protein